MIKNLKNLFKPPAKRREKENDEPSLLPNSHHHSSHYHGQRKMQVGRSILQRRVNFHGQQGADDFDTDQNSEDGGSEVTLTTTANEPHHYGRQPLPNPYSVVTEPKKNRGPRSCPGGGRAFDLDEELSHRSIGRGARRAGAGRCRHHQQQQQFLDDSLLDTRSEFIAPQQRLPHRRSCRRRAVTETAAVDEQPQQQQPFREIGNNGGGGGNGRSAAMSSRRLSVADFYPYDANRHHLSVVSSSSFSSRYKNVPPLTERHLHKNFTADDENAMEQEIWNLSYLYQLERAKRKDIQQKLRSQMEKYDLLIRQYNTLSYNCLLARHQQQNAAAVFPPNFPPNNMFDIFSNNWNGGTPSSSSAMPSTPAAGTTAPMQAPQLGPPPPIALPTHLWPSSNALPPMALNHPKQQQQNSGHIHHQSQQQLFFHTLSAPNAVQQQQQKRNGGGAGEQLASLFSDVSIDEHHRHPPHNNLPLAQQRQQKSAPPPPIPPREHNAVPTGHGEDKFVVAEEEDELKDFRRGQHNSDSFSGSSRPTTGELRDMKQLKEELVTDSSKESHQNATPSDDDDYHHVISDSSSFPRNYSSLTTPEAARGGNGRKNNATFLGISFSADQICAAGGFAFTLTDSPTPPPKDDGYATSETNLSEMGILKDEKQSKKVVGMLRSKSLE